MPIQLMNICYKEKKVANSGTAPALKRGERDFKKCHHSYSYYL